MATHIAVDLQKKIYEILKADVVIQNYGFEVLDHVPDNNGRPYITVGDDVFEDFSTHTDDSFRVEVTIHVWNEAQGRKLNKEVLSRVYELLHETDLELTGQKTISLRMSFMNTILDADGRTYHGIIRFNLLLGG